MSPADQRSAGGSIAPKEGMGKMAVRVQTLPRQPQRPFFETVRIPIRQFFQQFRIIRRAVRHPQVPLHAKIVAGCAVLYVFSPIQLIPNFIPIIGQMDDVLVVSLGIKFLRRFVPQNVLDDCENGAHL
jgi:uncharacterized membrane protein YkvA (DUF1232 family)